MAAVAIDTDEATRISDESEIQKAIQNDASLQDIAAKFESDLIIDADTEITVAPTDIVPKDSDSASNSSSYRDLDDNIEDSDDSSQPRQPIENGGGSRKSSRDDISSSNENTGRYEKHLKPESKSSKSKKLKDKSKKLPETDISNSKEESATKSRKNPLKMLKKLTKFDKSKKHSSFRSQFETVSVGRLPQVFVAKYLGHREATGLSGLHHVRKPVDEMVRYVKEKLEAKEEPELPLLYVVVSQKGLDLRDHQRNKVKDVAPLGILPIDFISYGVQDIKYWRVFTCIVVRTLSWQSRSATCHAFLCDSASTGRKMALALGAAFSAYSKKLKADGKTHNFQVELRPPDEITEALVECEA